MGTKRELFKQKLIFFSDALAKNFCGRSFKKRNKIKINLKWSHEPQASGFTAKLWSIRL